MDSLEHEHGRTYEPRYTKGQMGVDSQERIDFSRLRKERLQRAHQQMKTSGHEALLLFDGDNIRYVTGLFDYGWRTYMRYCLLPADQEPIMFDTVGVDLECTRFDAPWIRDRLEPAIVWKVSGTAEERGWSEIRREPEISSWKIWSRVPLL